MPHIPNNAIRGGAAVGIGGVVDAAKVEQHGADEGKITQKSEQGAKLIVQKAVADPLAVGSKRKRSVCDDEAGDAVEGVLWAITHGSKDSDESGAGDKD